jgi:hypothetical protein
VKINGISGHVVANQIGDYREFGPVYYCPEAATNIISLGSLDQLDFEVNFVQRSHFEAIHEPTKRSYMFKMRVNRTRMVGLYSFMRINTILKITLP